MAQFFGTEDIKDLTKASQTTIEWASGSSLRIGGQAYNVTSVLTLDTATDIDTGAIANDTIYYVYAVVVAGTVSLKYSLSNSAPTGYSAYRRIGVFKTDGSAEILAVPKQDNGSVGDIIHSMLTEEQFIAENGVGWVLADGRTAGTSKYATLIGANVPDMRGQFLRGLDTSGVVDPDGAGRTLGSSQVDTLQGHFHNLDSWATVGTTGDKIRNSNPNNGNYRSLKTSGLTSDGVNGTPRVSQETRSKNIAVNIFIKIEDIAI